MKNIPTPRTAQLRAESIGFYSCATVPASLCAEIEAEEIALRAENARLIGVIQSHADAGLVAQTALRAALEYAEAATCDLWEDLKAYGDLSRAIQVAAVIVKSRAALAGKEGAC